MRILPFLVLLSALAIAGCAAFFSIVGLKLLFVGGGVSIVIMGIALEVGKLITATFLKHRWNQIGTMLKIYMISATFVLVCITSVGIYGYLSFGYNATSMTVRGYEHAIETNESKMSELEKEISIFRLDKYNTSEILAVEENRKLFTDRRLQLIAQKNSQLEKIRTSSSGDRSRTNDMLEAKQVLELSQQSLESDMSKEIEQIKLYNSRVEILDKEIQKWIDIGRDSVFRKSGLDRAREVKTSQKAERDDIDIQIRRAQDKIENLRSKHEAHVKEYNNRVAEIEQREKTQQVIIEEEINKITTEISSTVASIDAYNKEVDLKVRDLNNYKDKLLEQNKKKIEEDKNIINSLLKENNLIREKISHTDVGTFKFIAKSLNIELDKAVNYFIWIIMFVFDPLAVCLILAYNSLIQVQSVKIKNNGYKREDLNSAKNFVLPDTIQSSEQASNESSTPLEEFPPLPTYSISPPPSPPPTPVVPHGISSGKTSPNNF